ncbi:hypothetical protein SAMN04487788_1369 [Microbacterium testaceum StLB037]|uniref:Uncharacterized protein n=1 Tax=Microbacterium testaceum (strain StLB037) TaxID=979556 RepID=A0A1H0NIN2_MICTS|nr:hypothetical protein [Microbacterium testaceum]SDO92622.1 hypothetical protein SAMN04487788_1369 [Microbacterium testaceum StLB037]
MTDALEDFDLDPQLGARGAAVQPASTPVIRLSRIICKTILITGACGSTQTTGRC